MQTSRVTGLHLSMDEVCTSTYNTHVCDVHCFVVTVSWVAGVPLCLLVFYGGSATRTTPKRCRLMVICAHRTIRASRSTKHSGRSTKPRACHHGVLYVHVRSTYLACTSTFRRGSRRQEQVFSDPCGPNARRLENPTTPTKTIVGARLPSPPIHIIAHISSLSNSNCTLSQPPYPFHSPIDHVQTNNTEIRRSATTFQCLARYICPFELLLRHTTEKGVCVRRW